MFAYCPFFNGKNESDFLKTAKGLCRISSHLIVFYKKKVNNRFDIIKYIRFIYDIYITERL